MHYTICMRGGGGGEQLFELATVCVFFFSPLFMSFFLGVCVRVCVCVFFLYYLDIAVKGNEWAAGRGPSIHRRQHYIVYLQIVHKPPASQQQQRRA